MELHAVTTDDLPGIRAVTVATGQADTDSGADPDYVAVIRKTGTAVVARGSGARGSGVLGWAGALPTPLGTLLTDLFVDPVAHARGVGTALLAALGPIGFTFSSKHPAAMPLYLRAGLVPSWPLLYLSGPVGRLPRGVLRVERVDAPVAAGVEAALTGAPPREAVYRYWSRLPGGFALVVRDRDRPIAAGAGRSGVLAHLAGGGAGALFAALTEVGEYAAFCVPGPHPAVRLLLASGFRVDDFDVTMRTPDVVLPTDWVYSPGLA